MSECIKNLEEVLNLSYSLIGELILMEKSLIDKRYTQDDFFDKYIHIATILDDKLEKTIYHYSTSLNFFVDIFKNIDDFIEKKAKKDYRAVFINDKLMNHKEIKKLFKTNVKVYWITGSLLTDNLNENIKLIDINKRSEYIKHLKELKLSVSKKYKKQFYLEIIKQNHEIEFSNYLALKSKFEELTLL